MESERGAVSRCKETRQREVGISLVPDKIAVGSLPLKMWKALFGLKHTGTTQIGKGDEPEQIVGQVAVWKYIRHDIQTRYGQHSSSYAVKTP